MRVRCGSVVLTTHLSFVLHRKTNCDYRRYALRLGEYEYRFHGVRWLRGGSGSVLLPTRGSGMFHLYNQCYVC